MKQFAFILCLYFMQTLSVSAAETALGVWVWKSQAFESEKARSELISFCRREGISHLDLHLSLKKEPGGEVLQNRESLRRLLSLAAKHKISVNALRGDPKMFFEHNRTRTLRELKTILDFNQSLPAAERFAGIKYDVEPYLTQEWQDGGNSRQKVIDDYLQSLLEAKKLLKEISPQTLISTDIPSWWDKPAFATEFLGEKKLFVRHIQDLNDWTGIMSYRRDSKLVMKLVSQELAYADLKNKAASIAPALETGKLHGAEAKISFAGAAPHIFRKELARLRELCREESSVRCIMLHHYGSLRNYLSTP